MHWPLGQFLLLPTAQLHLSLTWAVFMLAKMLRESMCQVAWGSFPSLGSNFAGWWETVWIMETLREDCDVREGCEIEIVPVHQWTDARFAGCCLHPFQFAEAHFSGRPPLSMRLEAKRLRRVCKRLNPIKSCGRFYYWEVKLGKSLESLGKLLVAGLKGASCNWVLARDFPQREDPLGMWGGHALISVHGCLLGRIWIYPSHISRIVEKTHVNLPCSGLTFGSVEKVWTSKILQAPLFDAPGTSSEGIAEIQQAGTGQEILVVGSAEDRCGATLLSFTSN